MPDNYNFINHLSLYNLDLFENVFFSILQKTKELLCLEESLELSVNIVSPKFQKKLNKKYRNKNYVADVLSFEMEEDSLLEDIGYDFLVLGDIFICYDKAVEQSKLYQHSLKREMSFLFLHGLLHLLGYNHIEKDEESVMFGLQDKILNALNITRTVGE